MRLHQRDDAAKVCGGFEFFACRSGFHCEILPESGTTTASRCSKKEFLLETIGAKKRE